METQGICVCELIAPLQCSRCRSVYYCGIRCQKDDWASHKKVCGQLAVENMELIIKMKREQFINLACDRISGNILIAASYGLHDHTSGIVHVNFTESIDEFMAGNTLHAAYINFIPDSFAANSITANSITTIFKLTDYETQIKTPLKSQVVLDNLKNKYPRPEEDWVVFFNI